MSETTAQDTSTGRRILVIGGGPAAHRFVQSMLKRGLGQDTITVLSEEQWTPYDRVAEVLDELGVDEVVPWQAARSIVRWRGEKATKALAT